MPQAIAIAADVDEVTVMDEAIDERRRHDLVAEDLAPSPPKVQLTSSTC